MVTTPFLVEVKTTLFMAEEGMTRLMAGRVEMFSKATVEMTPLPVTMATTSLSSMATEVTTYSPTPTPQEH